MYSYRSACKRNAMPMKPRAAGPAFAAGFPANSSSMRPVVEPATLHDGVRRAVRRGRHCIDANCGLSLVRNIRNRDSMRLELFRSLGAQRQDGQQGKQVLPHQGWTLTPSKRSASLDNYSAREGCGSESARRCSVTTRTAPFLGLDLPVDEPPPRSS